MAPPPKSTPPPPPVSQSHFFGAKLETVMARDDHVNEMLPKIVRWAIYALYWGYIRYNKGLSIHGIFRESGNNENIQQWKEMFEDDLVEDFKLYLRSLPEPLMRFENYSPIVEVVRTINFGDESETFVILKIIKECISVTLTKAQSRLLYATLRLLQHTTKLSAINMMRSSNLGIVFGQCLFRDVEITPYMLYDTQYLNKAVAMMIGNVDKLFDMKQRPDLAKLDRELFHSGTHWNDATPAAIDNNEPEYETTNALYGVDPSEYERDGVETDVIIPWRIAGAKPARPARAAPTAVPLEQPISSEQNAAASDEKRKSLMLPKGSVDGVSAAAAAAARPKSMAIDPNAGLLTMMEYLKKKQEYRQSGNSASIDDKLAEEKKKREEAALASAQAFVLAKSAEGQMSSSSGGFKKPASSNNLGWANELRDKLRDKSGPASATQTYQQEQQTYPATTTAQPQAAQEYPSQPEYTATKKSEEQPFYDAVALKPGYTLYYLKEELFQYIMTKAGWRQLHDTTTQRNYYYHPQSRQTSWELPYNVIEEFYKLAEEADQNAHETGSVEEYGSADTASATTTTTVGYTHVKEVPPVETEKTDQTAQDDKSTYQNRIRAQSKVIRKPTLPSRDRRIIVPGNGAVSSPGSHAVSSDIVISNITTLIADMKAQNYTEFANRLSAVLTSVQASLSSAGSPKSETVTECSTKELDDLKLEQARWASERQAQQMQITMLEQQLASTKQKLKQAKATRQGLVDEL